MTTTTTTSIADIVRPFASRDRRPPAAAIRGCLLTTFDGGERATATDLEVAGTVTVRDGVYRPQTLQSLTGDGSPADFPVGVSRPLDAAGCCVTLHYRHLTRIADHVAVVSDNESSRYALGGVLLELPEGGPLVAVASDGRRLHAARFTPDAATGTLAGPGTGCIVPARAFKLTAKTIRAAARAVLGLTGRRLDAAITSQPVTVGCDGREITLHWSSDCGRVSVLVRARLMEGRFPRWRDCIPDRPMAVGNSAEWSALADWCRGVVKMTKTAAAAAGEAAAETVRAKGGRGAESAATSVGKAAAYRHPRGVRFCSGGAAAAGCDAAIALPGWSSPTTLDPAFVADACDALVEWGTAAARITDPQSAVVISTSGWDSGSPTGFLAVIMPLAQD